ncbi:hypothetical protein RRG08_064012 [Elysia crispata]|uniref:Uncharacterized protein n=1 Tax=Elysia crispata TaxID=231223 RepID=A0AAE1CXJ6_9GAST|nr:hypothetical protein RRG08_064012 [Elysia crispata]
MKMGGVTYKIGEQDNGAEKGITGCSRRADSRRCAHTLEQEPLVLQYCARILDWQSVLRGSGTGQTHDNEQVSRKTSSLHGVRNMRTTWHLNVRCKVRSMNKCRGEMKLGREGNLDYKLVFDNSIVLYSAKKA